MSEQPTKKSRMGITGGFPHVVPAASRELVKMDRLVPNKSLPLVVEPATKSVDLVSWAEDNRERVEQELLANGAILLRGFGLNAPDDLQRFALAVSKGELIEYRERSSPRSTVSGLVYTSTDYPADQSIFLHNENSYAHNWPKKLFFFCQSPAELGGETPIADVRKVLTRIDAEIVQQFARKGVLYVRNFSDAVGLSWKTVFQTEDRNQVEDYCRQSGYDFEWRDNSRLRTRRIGQAVATHPQTGEKIWFNHAAFFHISTLPQTIWESLLHQCREEDLPNHTYYGDGSQIEPSTIEQIREAYRSEAITFQWRMGDLLIIDNMLVAHGRAPYQGRRKILVAMSEPFSSDQLSSGQISRKKL